jgi:hypothetical protein
LIAILYKTHKNLHSTCKVSGLYAFDALARAARSYANKHKLPVDSTTDKGNCASFLQKMEGVLDGLVKDMLASDNDEAKVCYNFLPHELFPYQQFLLGFSSVELLERFIVVGVEISSSVIGRYLESVIRARLSRSDLVVTQFVSTNFYQQLGENKESP